MSGMVHTPRGRDTVRLTVSAATAVVGAASLTAVGWLAGAAARQQGVEQARTDAEHSKAVAAAAEAKARYDAAVAERRFGSAAHRVLLRPRPSRTVVHTRYLSASAGSLTVGGGTFSTPTSPQAPPVAQQPAPVQHAPPAPPPPPPPPPPPAPSSGS
jgi:hypothetical protein